MGSTSDWETLEYTVTTLISLHVPDETRVVSAHRTPDQLFEYAASAEERGIEVLIAGAGGAIPPAGYDGVEDGSAGSWRSCRIEDAKAGLDSLLSIAQMPGGIPVGTLAIGKAGAINAALLAAAILGTKYPWIREALRRLCWSRRTKFWRFDPSSSAKPPKKGRAVRELAKTGGGKRS